VVVCDTPRAVVVVEVLDVVGELVVVLPGRVVVVVDG
jgi:hypothetical protein